ncbi:MAG: cupin domain-containing protein [Candidatus Helarchaeota archaeon]
MKIVKIDEAKEVPNPHNVSARKIIEHKHVTVIYLDLKKGEELRRHITPVDVFFYVIEGKGIVEIGDESKEISKETIILSPAKIPHKLKNPESERFRVLVVKTPKPTTETKLL